MENSCGIILTMVIPYSLLKMTGCHRLGFSKVLTGWTNWRHLIMAQMEVLIPMKKYQMENYGNYSIGVIIFKKGKNGFW